MLSNNSFALNTTYTIVNKEFNLVFDIESLSNGSPILLRLPNSKKNQQFICFKLDGGLYTIANQQSGKIIDLRGFTNSYTLVQNIWNGQSSQIWYVNNSNIPEPYYKITNQQNGKVAQSMNDSHDMNPYVTLTSWNGKDEQQWHFIPKDSIEFPNIPEKQPLPNPPEYFSNPYEVLPLQTTPVIIAFAFLPCIFVQDNEWDHQTKIQHSPYYTFVKEQYWERIDSTTLEPGQTNTFQYKTGIKTTDQQSMMNTIGMSIGADLGFQFNQTSIKIHTQFLSALEATKSTTSEQLSETTITDSITNTKPTKIGITKYQLITRYSLLRTDDSLVTEPWKISDHFTTKNRSITG
ncbi:RICIN domain-containing protein [Bacillus cereus]|uniref:RICIN domain-containing protein n=1 Tax=Bacillus cereus TaxID=1396 RepID=UPI0009AB0A75|nr:RICIN domain-containing protein [Bacillus cereus]PEQ68071.1 hypothetical protein CN469_04305 [Bacillus cereus]